MNTPALSEWLVVRPVTNLVQLRENPNANGSLGNYDLKYSLKERIIFDIQETDTQYQSKSLLHFLSQVSTLATHPDLENKYLHHMQSLFL